MISQMGLEKQEIEYLIKHFRLTTNASLDRKYSITASDLLVKEECLTYLESVTELLKSPSTRVTASLFSKRYSYLTVVPSLFAMTKYNKALDFSIQNVQIESEVDKGTWLPNIRLKDDHIMPLGNDRDQWRDLVIENIFAKNIAKVWLSFSKMTKIPKNVLWENTAVYVFWLYEQRMREEALESEQVRIQQDFTYLLEAPGTLFGEKENPLRKFYSPLCSTSSSENPIRKRKTCCSYYRISSSAVYCSTCPRKIK